MLSDRGFVFCLAFRDAEKNKFSMKCLSTVLMCAMIVPLWTWHHILHSYKYYVTIFATTRNKNGISCSTSRVYFPSACKRRSGTKPKHYSPSILTAQNISFWYHKLYLLSKSSTSLSCPHRVLWSEKPQQVKMCYLFPYIYLCPKGDS